MKLSQRITGWLQKRGLLAEPDSWFVRHFVRPAHSGVNVTEQSSLHSTAVFASLRLLGGTIASLPMPVYQELTPRGKRREKSHPLYKLLHDRPNPVLSSFQWRQTGISHQLLYGDWFNEIEYQRGQPVAIWPIPPWRVQVKLSDRGRIYYEVNLSDGQTKNIPAPQMIHIKNLSVDGLRGMGCIRAGAEAVGLSLAAEEFGAKFFGQGANMGGVAEHPNRLSPEAYERLRNDLSEKYEGLGSSHRIMLLEEGMKYQRVGIPPNEAQFLETRKFQVAEIGRLFGITQLHKIGDLDRATFSNIEQQNIEFIVDTIRPLLVNIEQEINYKLFNDQPYFTEFVVDGLLRGDSVSRHEAYSKSFHMGGLSVNEYLELENRNPIGPEGDKRFIPMNLISLEEAGAMPNPQEPDNNSRSKENRTIEQRNRAAMARARTAKSYERLFREAAQKIVTREKNHVVKALEKHLGERDLLTFDEWLDDFYREFRPYVERTMRPAITGLAEAIKGLAAQEVDAGDIDIQRMVDEFTEAQAYAHTTRSAAVIRQLINRAEEENLDTIAIVTERLDEWEENRPAQIANDSTVAVANRAAKVVFAGAGIQYLRWVAVGSDTCPYCQEMDGRIVGIDQPFLAKDGALDSEDGAMPINKPTLEPPLHKGCVCEIAPA